MLAELCHICRVQEDCKGAVAVAGDKSRMQHALLQDRVNTLQGGVEQLQREKVLTDEAVSAAAGDAVKCAVALDRLAEKVSRTWLRGCNLTIAVMWASTAVM